MEAMMTVYEPCSPKVGETLEFCGDKYRITKATPTKIKHDEWGRPADFPGYDLELEKVGVSEPI